MIGQRIADERVRDDLGREVRRIWVEWAREQTDPKPSWLVPWEDLGEGDREVDRRIGERLWLMGYRAGVNAGFVCGQECAP